MKVICPNFKNKEVKEQFEELSNVLGENTAYYVWSYNNGYSLDYAPNGAQSKLFSDLLEYYKGDRRSAIIAKAKTYSPSFRNWFGDWLNNVIIDDTNINEPLLLKNNDISKVIDKNNEPLIVYHNSFKNFNEFKIGEYEEYEQFDDQYMITNTMQSGVFFTTDQNYANAYGPKVYPCFLNLRNPNVDEEANLHTETVAKFRYIDEFAAPENGMIPSDGLIGHDVKTLGIESKGTEYVAFHPNQIKSIDNRGTYSQDNNNIYQYAVDSKINRIDGEESRNIVFFKENQLGKESLQNMLLNNFFEEDSIEIANNIYNKLDDSVQFVLDNDNKGYDAAYDAKSKKFISTL